MWPNDGEQPSSNVIISVLKRMSNNCILDVSVIFFGVDACFGCTFARLLRSDNLISEYCEFCDILGCHPNRTFSKTFQNNTFSSRECPTQIPHYLSSSDWSPGVKWLQRPSKPGTPNSLRCQTSSLSMTIKVTQWRLKLRTNIMVERCFIAFTKTSTIQWRTFLFDSNRTWNDDLEL